MEIAHLRHFYAVAKHGGFTAAAKELRISQSTISKTVKQIEEDQGIRLFDRGTRFVRLTESGKRFLESCETIFQEFENLHRISELHRAEVSGAAAFGASDNLCNYVLPEILRAFRADYPKVEITLNGGTADSIKTEILKGIADFGFFYTPVQEPGLHTSKIAFVEFAVVYSPKLKGKLKSVESLSDMPYVGSRTGDYAKPYPALRMLQSLGVKPTMALETNNQETQKRLALAGMGYTVAPSFMVAEELAEGKLLALKTPKLIGSDLFFVKKKGRLLPKAADTLSLYLSDALVQRSPGIAARE